MTRFAGQGSGKAPTTDDPVVADRQHRPSSPIAGASAQPLGRPLLAAVAACALALPAPAAGETPKFRKAIASWYGPGLWGNPLGCGGTLRWGTIGVAHKTMRCGKRLRFCVRRCRYARVIDRGPYVDGREFDLTQAFARRVGFRGVGRVWVRDASSTKGER